MGTGDTGRRPAPAARVLVVEDEAAIRAAVEQALVDGGFVVGGRGHGLDLEQVLAGFRPDLVILDIMLPGRDGFRLLEVVREHTDAAVILLTARDGVDDRLRGLDSGADDYVIKPFLLAELVSRVRAVLRRRGRVPTAIQYGDLVIDEQSGTASRAGAVLELTATELRLLGYLAEQRGRTVTKNQILTQVWGYDDYDPNIVEVHVSGLRRKLESRGPRIVHTVRGLGYKLGPPEPGQPS
jgi:two-component system, OmpR family, response regulator